MPDGFVGAPASGRWSSGSAVVGSGGIVLLGEASSLVGAPVGAVAAGTGSRSRPLTRERSGLRSMIGPTYVTVGSCHRGFGDRLRVA
ncbi:hypothetical protein CUD01_07940 [Cellulomonas uda]|uniref:Uncharacterized protein n=1 Tax=Cellulomonas uda TaxID=1714 RepID=A0A4Y3KBX2_CELUD|nr:hypothetical protein CUD01_07940 [Cellulomonas uda]